MQWRVTGWGWELALLSIMPLVHPLELVFALVIVTPSNVCFIAAAIAAWRGRQRLGQILALAALASMIASAFMIAPRASELVRLPYGLLGPGYYVWVTAGALLLWTAFSSRLAR